ncbi:PD40 domain-containing protein [Candidatus Poribacteria bacterium]|nr:PD40 domain-containing protein [Candidatus Poribacteria bacterium]
MKNTSLFLLCGLIFNLLCISTCLVFAQAPGVSKIAFTSDPEGNRDIHLMNPNGSRQINLTHHPAQDYMPAFSPTGTQILFVSSRDGVPDLYLMDTDGTNVQRVFDAEAHRHDPTWSPDGKWIAYHRGPWHDNSELYIASIDERVEHRIAWVGHAEAAPSWSPGGTEVAFVVNVPFINGIGPLTNTKIVFVDVQTRVEETFLPEKLPLMESPAWSPIADIIAFSWRKLGLGQRSALFISNRDGEGVARIVAPTWDPAVSEVNPVWSPDGSELIYEHSVEKPPREGRAIRDIQLYKTDLNGGDPKQLTRHGTNKDPDWFDPAFALSVQPQPYLLTTIWGKLKQK